MCWRFEALASQVVHAFEIYNKTYVKFEGSKKGHGHLSNFSCCHENCQFKHRLHCPPPSLWSLLYISNQKFVSNDMTLILTGSLLFKFWFSHLLRENYLLRVHSINKFVYFLKAHSHYSLLVYSPKFCFPNQLRLSASNAVMRTSPMTI